jgi:LPS-assembly lipoprotein
MQRTPVLIALSVAGLTLAGLSLAGCGFTPLYATNGAGAALAAIDIRPPKTNTDYKGTAEDRTSFLFKQSLTDELASRNAGPARYVLDTTLTERRLPRGVRVNNVANQYEVNMTVAYVLTDGATGKLVLKGSAPVIVYYDSADPPYAGTVGAQNGEERAAQQAAIQVRLALARFFAGRPESGPGPVETPQTATSPAQSAP